jgi:hypothetical protein
MNLYEQFFSVTRNKIIRLKYDYEDGYFFELYKSHKSTPVVADLELNVVRKSVSEAIEAAIEYLKYNELHRSYYKTNKEESNNFFSTTNEVRYKIPRRK